MNSLDVPTVLPWWKSRVIMGALTSAILKLAAGFGLLVEVTDDQTQAFVTVLLLVASLVGDAVAARGRITQKYAPPISATGSAKLRSPMIAALAALALLLVTTTGCAALSGSVMGDSAPPGQNIDDDRAALPVVVEKIYAGWRTALTLALASGLVDDDLEARLLVYDTLIRGAYEAARLARGAGDAEGIAAAVDAIQQLVSEAVRLFKGG